MFKKKPLILTTSPPPPPVLSPPLADLVSDLKNEHLLRIGFWGAGGCLNSDLFCSVTHNLKNGWKCCFLIFSNEFAVFAYFSDFLVMFNLWHCICSLGSSMSFVASSSLARNNTDSMCFTPVPPLCKENWGTKCALKTRENIQDSAERFNFPSLSKKRGKLFL